LSIYFSVIFLSFIARRTPGGVTIVGGRGQGSASDQLSYPWSLYIHDDDTIVIADSGNNRIIEWKQGATTGHVIAGENGEGNRMNQLKGPTCCIIDKETNSLIICDRWNRQVKRWSRQQETTSGEILIDNIGCYGLAMDNQKYLYITDCEKSEVIRYQMGNNTGTIVAGGNGQGDHLNQLNWPQYVFVDGEQSVYVSDSKNNRVMKWVKGATEGIVVAGGRGQGDALNQLSSPQGLFVDKLGTISVVEFGNDRVTRWCKGMQEGTVIVGGNGDGSKSDQLSGPNGLSFDRHGNLYVVDYANHRVQRFSLEKN
jgi:sugar lactone lactonase YvrE